MSCFDKSCSSELLISLANYTPSSQSGKKILCLHAVASDEIRISEILVL